MRLYRGLAERRLQLKVRALIWIDIYFDRVFIHVISNTYHEVAEDAA